MGIRPIFSERQLTPYKEGQEAEMPEEPILINGQEEYEVERILRERISRGKLQLLIRWKGYGPEYDTWQTLDTLTNAVAAVTQYYKEHESQYPSKRKVLEDWIEKYTNPNITA